MHHYIIRENGKVEYVPCVPVMRDGSMFFLFHTPVMVYENDVLIRCEKKFDLQKFIGLSKAQIFTKMIMEK